MPHPSPGRIKPHSVESEFFIMAESKDEEAALPEGCYGFILSRKQTEEWGLKTGKGLLAVVESAYLDKEAIVNDIQAKAKLSPFHPLKSKIEVRFIRTLYGFAE